MATMFPIMADDAAAFTTSGEQRFYHFLQKALRPDAVFMAWYSPQVNGLEPDFIVYSPESGLIVFEVKDWTVDQIVEANPKYVRLSSGGQEQNRKNPVAQVREYINSLMKRMGKNVTLRAGHGDYAGKAMLPVSGGIAFMNITRQAFRDAGLHDVIPDAKVLFWDDMCHGSPLCADASGASLRQFLHTAFPPLFPFQMTPKQLDTLRWMLFPIVRIEVPRRAFHLTQAQEHVAALDHVQEQLARSFHTGKRLIRGPSGSGKTLILAHQASHLAQNNAKIRRILVTCFNLSLSNYIHRLLAHKQTPYGPEAVEVVPFYDLCGRILAENVPHSDEKTDYYQLVVAEARAFVADNERGATWRGRFDAILVDEGQDFNEDMVDVLLPLLHPDHGVLTVALDEQQALYTKGAVWKAKVPHIQEHLLRMQYRNSQQITRFVAQKLALPFDAQHCAGSQGPAPTSKDFPDLPSLARHICDAVWQLVREGCPMAEIAVLYAKRQMKNDDVPVALRESLEAKGLMVSWVAEDARSKRRYDVTTDTVTLSTIHSVKGMDYAHVFLVGLGAEDTDYNKKLAYVGMTRARLGLNLCGVV